MVVSKPCDELRDTELAEEISLLGDVIAAADEVGRELSQAEVDEALGLQPRVVSRRRGRPDDPATDTVCPAVLLPGMESNHRR